MGVVVVPRQLQYIELVEDHKFPPIRMMHNAEEAENEGYRVPFPLHGAQRKRQSIKTRPTSTFTAASINELQDNLMESIATPCPVEVSGLITGKEAGLHTADPKKRRKKKSNMKELHTELLMGRQTGDYARHRAEQLEKFRGTPEPLLFRDFAKDHFMDHPSKGSAMGQRQSAYGAERLQSLPGHSPVSKPLFLFWLFIPWGGASRGHQRGQGGAGDGIYQTVWTHLSPTGACGQDRMALAVPHTRYAPYCAHPSTDGRSSQHHHIAFPLPTALRPEVHQPSPGRIPPLHGAPR